MRAKPTVMLFLALAVSAVSATAQTNSWALSQPGAKLLMGIDVKSLRESVVGHSIREQIENIAPMAVQSPLQGPMQAMAAGLLDQVDRVFVSSSGGPSAVFAASTKNKAPLLLAVEGRFPHGRTAAVPEREDVAAVSGCRCVSPQPGRRHHLRLH